MKITVIIDGQEKEIELSDEQIIAIGQKFFSLPCPTTQSGNKFMVQPIDEAFCIPIESESIKFPKGECVTFNKEKMTNIKIIKNEKTGSILVVQEEEND